MPITLICHLCGKEFSTSPSRAKWKKHFCSGDCKNQYLKKHNPRNKGGWKRPDLSEYNKTKNPMNKPDGWTQERRNHQRATKLNGDIKPSTYKKYYGKHEHRVVVEKEIGRALTSDEIVHHIDGDKHNNSPDNLMIVTRSEHAKIHFAKRG